MPTKTKEGEVMSSSSSLVAKVLKNFRLRWRKVSSIELSHRFRQIKASSSSVVSKKASLDEPLLGLLKVVAFKSQGDQRQRKKH